MYSISHRNIHRKPLYFWREKLDSRKTKGKKDSFLSSYPLVSLIFIPYAYIILSNFFKKIYLLCMKTTVLKKKKERKQQCFVSEGYLKLLLIVDSLIIIADMLLGQM